MKRSGLPAFPAVEAAYGTWGDAITYRSRVRESDCGLVRIRMPAGPNDPMVTAEFEGETL